MDDQRFDSLSRVIARSTTRRATIKGVAAVLGGGIFASVFGIRPQLAGAQGTGQPGDDCSTGEDCESGNCSESGTCYCVDPSEPWRGCDCNTGTESPCGGGTLLCCATGSEPGGPGICTSSMEGCNPTGECSADPGEDCQTNADCCTGTCMSGICACVDPSEPWRGCDCNTGTESPCGGGTLLCCATGSEPGGPGICTSSMEGCNPTGECSADPGEDCQSDADCCTGTCQGGICACSDPDRPWVGCPCTTGTENPCGGGVCCATGTEPGGPGTCISPMATCEPPTTCSAANEKCTASSDCCGSLVCLDSGVCGTTTVLPNTGAGMTGGGTDLGTLAGLAAAAGAAAIAARKLSPKASPANDEL